MRKKNAIDIIGKILREVEYQSMSPETMLKEVQMMQFKIRPIAGDITMLDSLHQEIIESLWKIGKIDEIISKSFEDLEEGDQTKLLDYLHKMESRTQEKIKESLNKVAGKSHRKLLKLEVFKDLQPDPIIN